MKEKETDTVDYAGIGRRIRRYRMLNELSQEQLAEIVDISTTHMSHIETANTKLSLPVFITIAEALSVSTDALLHDRTQQSALSLYDEVLSILDGCSSEELLLLSEIMKSSLFALRKYILKETGQNM